MADYLYHAIDSHGATVDGVMAAESEDQLDTKLQELGYWLIEVSEQSATRKLREKPVPRKEMIDFFNGLNSMLVAGIPVTDALTAIADETVHEGFAKVLRDLKVNVEAGTSLDEAMSKHPKIFGQQIVNLIKAGGFSGNLPMACEDISEHLEWVDKIMADVKQASIYPIMILTAVLGLVFLMFTFVVPRFAKVFDNLKIELPLLTRAVVDIGAFFNSYWWAILLAVAAIIAFFKFGLNRLSVLEEKLDRYALNLPVFGDLNRMIVQSRFCHNLAILLRAGVPILDALSLCRGLVDNRIMEKVVAEAETAVNEGRKMTEVLRQYDIISPIVLRMIVVGEETGKLDQALEQASHRFDKEVPRQIKRVFSVIEPMIMITLIVIVGLIGGAVFMPMFSLMGGIG